MKTAVIDRVKGLVAGLTGGKKFDKLDFGTLKTAMMLAAVDGEVTADEIGRFKEMAEQCRGCNETSFEALWESALHSAGYLLLQSSLLPADKLVDAFVRETEKDFVREVIQEIAKDRDEAFVRLSSMAAADGDYSDIERQCLEALAKCVKEKRDQAVAERYSRATICQ